MIRLGLFHYLHCPLVLYPTCNQSVEIDNEGLLNNDVYLLGASLLSLVGQKTGELPYNASSEEVKAALEELCNVQKVGVTRFMHCFPDPLIGCMRPDGYIWSSHLYNSII